MPAAACPCGSGALLSECCAPLIDGACAAPDAEVLMRSRYTAYTLQHEAYLLATWHRGTRPAALDLKAGPVQKWLELEVLRHTMDAYDPARAVVEFSARYKVHGRVFRLHEISRFVLEDGRWFYLDGDLS